MGSYNNGADAGLIAVVVIVDILILAGLYVWTALSLNAVFRKVGEPSWGGWVPYYNGALLLKLGGFSPYLMFIVLFPYLGPLAVWVLLIISAYRINIAFGYREGAGVGMTFLAALLLPVWSSVLGWGSARWVGPDPRLRAAAMGTAPGYGTGYPQAGHDPQSGYGGGYARHSGDAGAYDAPAAAWQPGPADAPPAPEGYVPPVAPVGYVPPAAPVGYVPPTVNPAAPIEPHSASANDSFASPTAASVDEDLEGVDDPVPSRRRRSGAMPSPATPPTGAGSVIDGVPAATAAPVSAAATHAGSASEQPAGEDTATDGARPAGASDPVDPWAPPAPVPASRRSPLPDAPADFSDTSAEVSAVAGAPNAGVPLSARSSVSAARRHQPTLPDAESAFDETIIAPRRRTEWMLTPPLGAPIRLTAPVLILGRRPAADAEYPQAQLIDLADETRTVSKTHARLELAADRWTITDLGSTNGVVLIDEHGTETDLPTGASHLVGERFLLGDAELRLTRGKD